MRRNRSVGFVPSLRATLIVGAALVIVSGGFTGRPAGATDIPLAGTSLIIRNGPAPENASKRKIIWRSQDAALTPGDRGSSDDPRCVESGGGGGGGLLRFFSDRSAGSTEDTGDIALPCGNWSALGSSTSPKGYLYSDRDRSEGPCRRVVVTSGKAGKAVCDGRRSPLAYDLVPGIDQGTVATLLRVGTSNRYCTAFDGMHGRNGADGRVFRSVDAAPPASCPLPFPVCGDAIVGPSEQCDDGNTTAGDGCAADCRYEPLCLLTHNGGDPATASVLKLSPDGTLGPASNVTLAGALHYEASITRCGRHVYLNVDGGVAGFEVGLDGVLTPVPGATGLLSDVARLLCSPTQDLLFVFNPGVFLAGLIHTYTVGPDGALTLAMTNGGGNPSGGRMFAEFHPVTGELFYAGSYTATGPGPDLDTAFVARATYDAAGQINVVQQTYLNTSFAGTRLGGFGFTADAGVLSLLGFYDGSNTCFGYWDAPGVVIPSLGSLIKVCTAPFPADYRGFVPRPEGGRLFYFQTGSSLHAAEFTGSSIVSDSSIVPVHDTERLLLAFDGRVLISLGPGASEVATYDVAPDLVTLTPNGSRAAGATPRDGVLLPCPEL